MNSRICKLKIVIAAALLFMPSLAISQEPKILRKLVVFYSPNCHRCTYIKNEIIPQIEKKFKGHISIEYYDITEIENFKFLLSLQEKYNAKIKNVWPVLYFEGQFLSGQDKVGEKLDTLITMSLKNIPFRQRQDLPEVDLIERFKAMGPFTVISAGLLDGVNPCAFTVIVFFISFLALQGYRKRELVAIGMFFIFAVFSTYVLIGIGLFGFFYRLRSFWWIAKIFNFSIGIFTIILGFFALYDFFRLKKTGITDGMVLQLPKSLKNRIHSVIGMHYRMSSQQKDDASRKGFFKLILSAIVTGFLVSILEAVCTGQVYLPTISFVLKTTHLKLQAMGYLLLYNFMFISPLAIIFIFVLLGVTSEQFARVLKRHLLTVKMLMAALFLGLGAFLVWRA